jgi:phosphoserine phosphatase
MAPFASFYFDCDSTLSSIEGVDELTRKLSEDERAELRSLTERAMNGDMPLAQVYEERLHVLAPTREELEAVGRFYIEHLVPDAEGTIAALRFLGKHVGIISGGLHQPVLDLARHLGIPEANVHAVPVLFDSDGTYQGFDRRSALWQNHGKVRVLQGIPGDHRPVLFTGDGVTDLEAKDVVDLFVGFGGVERRARVEAEADVYVTRNSLAAVLDVGLTRFEKKRLDVEPEFASLKIDP